MKQALFLAFVVLVLAMQGCTKTENPANPVTEKPSYSVSGTILSDGIPVSGVTVSIGSKTALSDRNGNFTLSGIANGIHTLTPVKRGFSFTPASLTVKVQDAAVTAQDFSARTKLYEVTGVEDRVGENIPADFTWIEDGRPVKFSEISQGKPVFLHFWGTWCGTCEIEAPALNRLHTEFGDKMLFLGVAFERAFDDSTPLVENFMHKYSIKYLSMMVHGDLYFEMKGAYGGVPSIPTTFLIDAQGKIVMETSSYLLEEEWKAEIEKVLH